MTTTISIPITHTTDTTPAVAVVPRELSGPQWCSRFPRSSSTETLEEPFKSNVEKFLHALISAGAKYRINNTFRPLEACYLMHYCWSISRGKVNAKDVPTYPGVNINWTHNTNQASIDAAKKMCENYAIENLETAPALVSNHTKGLAIDMTISWDKELKILKNDGELICIKSVPRDNMNQDLWTIGASYGVKRFRNPIKDKPHWSIDGF